MLGQTEGRPNGTSNGAGHDHGGHDEDGEEGALPAHHAEDEESILRWMQSVENRLRQGGGGGGAGGGDDPPAVPTHLQKTKQLLDFGKYVLALVGTLVAAGWLGHEYVASFVTHEEVAALQQQNNTSHERLSHQQQETNDTLSDMRVSDLRQQLELRNNNDRIEQLLLVQRRDLPSRERQERVEELGARIERRGLVLQDPRRLHAMLRELDQNPARGLDL